MEEFRKAKATTMHDKFSFQRIALSLAALGTAGLASGAALASPVTAHEVEPAVQLDASAPHGAGSSGDDKDKSKDKDDSKKDKDKDKGDKDKSKDKDDSKKDKDKKKEAKCGGKGGCGAGSCG